MISQAEHSQGIKFSKVSLLRSDAWPSTSPNAVANCCSDMYLTGDRDYLFSRVFNLPHWFETRRYFLRGFGFQMFGGDAEAFCRSGLPVRHAKPSECTPSCNGFTVLRINYALGCCEFTQPYRQPHVMLINDSSPKEALIGDPLMWPLPSITPQELPAEIDLETV